MERWQVEVSELSRPTCPPLRHASQHRHAGKKRRRCPRFTSVPDLRGQEMWGGEVDRAVGFQVGSTVAAHECFRGQD